MLDSFENRKEKRELCKYLQIFLVITHFFNMLRYKFICIHLKWMDLCILTNVETHVPTTMIKI